MSAWISSYIIIGFFSFFPLSSLKFQQRYVPVHAFGATAPSLAPPFSRFLLTNLKPATNSNKASAPRMTARVTMAPITPATGLLTPPPPLPLLPLDEDAGAELVEEVLAHTPVLLPQAAHQSCWLPMANLFIPVTKSVQGMVVFCCPKSG